MFLKGSSSRISISAMGVISSHLKTLERNYQVSEKEDDDLHEQEEDMYIFYNDEDDTITVSSKDCQNSLL